MLISAAARSTDVAVATAIADSSCSRMAISLMVDVKNACRSEAVAAVGVSAESYLPSRMACIIISYDRFFLTCS